jgi:hypothetical protein
MPRYSTGCRNCVKRPTRCDELRPAYQNCKDIGVKCGGPRRGLIFINENRRAGQAQRRSKTGIMTKSHNYPTEAWSLSGITQVPQSTEQAAHSYVCFLWMYWDSAVGTNLRSHHRADWIEAYISNPTDCPVTCLALQTLSTAFFGRRNKQYDLVSHAFQLRGRTLTMLRRVIDTQDSQCTFDILATITTLRRWEYLMLTSGTAWRPHLKSISKIVYITGVEFFQHESTSSLLDENRLGIILEAYCQRTSCFLEQEEWKRLRPCSGSRQALCLTLQDYYSDLAHLCENITGLLNNEISGSRDAMEQATIKSDELLQNLENWRDDWSSHFNLVPQILSNNEPHGIYSKAEGLVFSSSLHYRTLQAAVTLNIFRYLKLRTLEWRHKLSHPFW